MSKRSIVLLLVTTLLFSLSLSGTALAKPEYISKMPAKYSSQSCNACHSTAPALNKLGKDWVAAGKSFTALEKKEAPATPTVSTKPVVKSPTTTQTTKAPQKTPVKKAPTKKTAVKPVAVKPVPPVLVKEFIKGLNDLGYTVETANGDAPLTREVAALLAMKALQGKDTAGINVKTADPNGLKIFSDAGQVSKSIIPYVSLAVKEGVLLGYENKKFGFQDKITAEQVQIVLARIEKKHMDRAKLINTFQGTEGYVGPEACAACHKEYYKKWETSNHTKKIQKGPSWGDQARKDRIYKWVQDKWATLDTYMIVDQKDKNTIYIDTDKVKIENVDFVIGEVRKQRYMTYYDGSPRKVWLAKTEDGGISWKLDKSQTIDFPGNKDRAGYKFLFIEVKPNGSENKNKYGEYRSWQERCIGCHVTGFDYKAWDAAKAAFKKGERANLKEIFVSDLRIGCEMCHGAGKAHVAAPSKSNILNPATLTDPEERLMVCGQCHTRTDKSTKSPLAHDLRGFNIANHDKYTDFATFTRPDWGKGNRQVSIDGKGRRDHQMDMDIRITNYLKPYSVHGKMTCFDCHDSHNINRKTSLVKESSPQDVCNKCHGSSNGKPNMEYKFGLDGARGWPATGFGKFDNPGGRKASMQHLFNLDSQGRVFGLAPDQYLWYLKPDGKATEQADWLAIWPWEKAKHEKDGHTVKIGAEPWKN